MKTEVKLLKHHLETINLLSFDERKELIKKYLEEKSYRQIANETHVPLSTLHGWATDRNKYRSNEKFKEMATTNQRLKAILEMFQSIEIIDNEIGLNFFKKISKEVARLKKWIHY